jgi:hypothetical protein
MNVKKMNFTYRPFDYAEERTAQGRQNGYWHELALTFHSSHITIRYITEGSKNGIRHSWVTRPARNDHLRYQQGA